LSYVPVSNLRGTEDTNTAYVTSDFSFTTAVLTIDTKTLHNAYARKFRIVNQDPTNNLNYQQGSPSGVSKPVPPNSEVVVAGWESFIVITPNAGTGKGFIELDLVNVGDAVKK
jgi:hypothetical protein